MKKSNGQSFFGMQLDEELLREMDAARALTGQTRSQFVRDSIALYLKAKLGKTLPAALIHAPDRAGVGGRPKKPAANAAYPTIQREAALIEDSPLAGQKISNADTSGGKSEVVDAVAKEGFGAKKILRGAKDRTIGKAA